MFYYIVLLGAIALFTWLEYAERRDNYQDALKLQQEFEAWSVDTSKKRPNNALFKQLYAKCYQRDYHAKTTYKGNRSILITEQADVVESFPSLHPQLIGDELAILDNLVDYFDIEFKNIKSVKSVILYALSLPLRLLHYVGIDEKHNNKLSQLILWIASLFLPQLKNLLIEFIDFILTKK